MLTVQCIYFKGFVVCKTIVNYNSSMKICTVCAITKPESDFFYRSRKANKLHSQCKDCYVVNRRKIWKEHYHKYGSHYRERAVERSKKIKDKLRIHMLEYLNGKSCVQCGINDIRVLEFDHIDPKTKAFGIARAITSTFSWERISVEIAKCQILCANCHKIKTAGEKNWYRNTS